MTYVFYIKFSWSIFVPQDSNSNTEIQLAFELFSKVKNKILQLFLLQHNFSSNLQIHSFQK